MSNKAGNGKPEGPMQERWSYWANGGSARRADEQFRRPTRDSVCLWVKRTHTNPSPRRAVGGVHEGAGGDVVYSPRRRRVHDRDGQGGGTTLGASGPLALVARAYCWGTDPIRTRRLFSGRVPGTRHGRACRCAVRPQPTARPPRSAAAGPVTIRSKSRSRSSRSGHRPGSVPPAC